MGPALAKLSLRAGAGRLALALRLPALDFTLVAGPSSLRVRVCRRASCAGEAQRGAVVRAG